MNAASNADTVQLIVPVNAKAMRVIRLTTAGVVANAGLTIDKTEDLKLAIEEACNCMIRNAACQALHLTFLTKGEAVSIQVTGSGVRADAEHTFDDSEMKVIECILGMMVDAFEIRREAERISLIELTVKTRRN